MPESLVFSAADRSYWDGRADILLLPLQSELCRRPSSSHIKSQAREKSPNKTLVRSIKDDCAHIRRPRRVILNPFKVVLRNEKKFPVRLLLADFVTKGNSPIKASSLWTYAIKAQVRIPDRTLAGSNRKPAIFTKLSVTKPVLMGNQARVAA
jgi:hypothetical protein